MLVEKLEQNTGNCQELTSGPVIEEVVDTGPIDDWQIQSSPAKLTRSSNENPVASYQKRVWDEKSGQELHKSNDCGTKRSYDNRDRNGGWNNSYFKKLLSQGSKQRKTW